MIDKIDWKCGDCGKTYTTEKLMALERIKAVNGDSNPKKQYGYISVCKCGYRFHRDKWQLLEIVEFPLNWFQALYGRVSTVFLELNHFGYHYETMVFLNCKSSCWFQNRYKTRAEARKGHEELLRKIKNREFKWDRKKKELIILDASCTKDDEVKDGE